MDPLDWIPVKSSVLAAVASYLDSLWIIFRTGEVYVYRKVPTETHQQFLAAESKGKFFNLHIRDNFPSEHVRRSAA